MHKINVKDMSERLARDDSVSDDAVRRALGRLDEELREIGSAREPIPIEIVFARAILRRARQARGGG